MSGLQPIINSAPQRAAAVSEKCSILLLYTTITSSHFYHGDYLAAKPKVVSVSIIR